MGKKGKSTKKKKAKADNSRIERFGSDGSEIKLVVLDGRVEKKPVSRVRR